jgi:hypothetical protein
MKGGRPQPRRGSGRHGGAIFSSNGANAASPNSRRF